MKIALFGNEFSSSYIKYINHLITKLESENVELIIHHKFYEFLQDSIDFSEKIIKNRPIKNVISFNFEYLESSFDKVIKRKGVNDKIKI